MTTQTQPASLALDYVKTIGIVNNGLNGRGFANPYDLQVTADGRIFVLNRADPARAAGIRIGICNLAEDYLGEFYGSAGQGDGNLVWPVAMAFDAAERLYVTDEYNHRITVFDDEGNFLHKWGAPGAGPGELNGPAGIAVGNGGDVYVVDQHNARVQRYASDGAYVGQWGSFGAAPGQFNLPWGMTTDRSGQVYVADWRNDRIQKFTPDGEFLAAFGSSGDGEGQFNRPTQVAVDEAGRIYVADWGNERVQIFAPDGEVAAILHGDAAASAWAQDYLDANPAEAAARRAANLAPAVAPWRDRHRETAAGVEARFWGPTSVSVDDEGRIYIVDSCRHRVQIYRKETAG